MARKRAWSSDVKRLLSQHLPPALSAVLAGPARIALTRRHARGMGLFASAKMSAHIPWESRLERDFIQQLEDDPEVVCFVAQPLRMDLVIEGRKRRHYPDFLVCRLKRPAMLAEVKPDGRSDAADFRGVVKAAKAACERLGISYEVVRESEIRTPLVLPKMPD
jgi:hypothetical protein